MYYEPRPRYSARKRNHWTARKAILPLNHYTVDIVNTGYKTHNELQGVDGSDPPMAFDFFMKSEDEMVGIKKEIYLGVVNAEKLKPGEQTTIFANHRGTGDDTVR